MIQQYSSSIRQLLTMALKISIFALDDEMTKMIISFSKSYTLILTVDTLDLEILIMTEKFQLMNMMVEYSVMLERVLKRKEELHQIKKKKSMKKGPVAFQGWF